MSNNSGTFLRTETICIDKLQPHPKNNSLMDNLNEVEFSILLEDIRLVGIKEALMVTEREDGTFTIISGHHRYKAACELEIQELRCDVHEYPDADSELLDIVRINVVRRSINVVEQAKLALDLLEKEGDLRKNNAKNQGRNTDGTFNSTHSVHLDKMGTEGGIRGRIQGKTGVSKSVYSLLLAVKGHPEAIREKTWEWLRTENPTQKKIMEEAKRLKLNHQKSKKKMKTLEEENKKLKQTIKDNGMHRAMTHNPDSEYVNTIDEICSGAEGIFIELLSKLELSKMGRESIQKTVQKYPKLDLKIGSFLGKFAGIYKQFEDLFYADVNADIDRDLHDKTLEHNAEIRARILAKAGEKEGENNNKEVASNGQQ